MSDSRLPSSAAADGPVEAGADSRVGIVCGRYRVLGELGVGDAGVVYEGVDEVLERSVALKFLSPAILAKPDVVGRIVQKTRALTRLSHPNVVTIYDIYRTEQDCCLVMELLSPESIGQILTYGGAYSWLEATRILVDCCGAVQAAHAAGITHGGIKPQNILYSLSGMVKLVDFGLVLADDTPWRDRAAQVSTVSYLSPEQAAGQGCDALSDLYSLGATYYALLSGQPPFSGATVDEVLDGHLHAPLPDPRAIVPEIPEACVQLLRQAMEKERSARYQDADELLTDLKTLLEGAPSQPLASPGARPNVAPSRRRFFAAATLSVLGLMGGEYLLLRGLARRRAPLLPSPLGPAAIAPPRQQSPPLKVGLLYALSGPSAVREHALFDATQLAIEELNAGGGLLGRRLQPTVSTGKSEESEDAALTEAGVKLLTQEKVDVVFFGDSSAARRLLIPSFESHDRLLFCPAPYEGLEESRHVVHTGGTPNQLCSPATKWCVETLGARKFFLIGTDDLRARAISALLQDCIAKVGAEVVGTHYALVGESQFSAVTKRLEECQPQVVLNLLAGETCGAFFAALQSADATASRLPVLSFAMGENELAELADLNLSGHYVARTRFADSDAPTAESFLSRFQKKYGVHRAVSEVMEAAYYGVLLWAAAVEKVGSEQVDAVRSALSQQEYALGSVRLRVDPSTQNTWKVFQLGKIRSDNSIEIVHTAEAPLPPLLFPPPRTRAKWSEFCAELSQKWGGHWANPERPDSARHPVAKELRKTRLKK